MIQAELNNKCGTLSQQEDPLTSTVFGILKWKLFAPELKAFLEHSRSYRAARKHLEVGNSLARVTKYRFWHRFSNNKEIDLIIETQQLVIGIEVKYDSKEGANQVTNYLHGLAKDFPGKEHVLVFLTREERPRLNDEDVTLADREHIYGLSWFHLSEVLTQSLHNSPEYKKDLIVDLLEYLEKRGLFKFLGFEVDIVVLLNQFFREYDFLWDCSVGCGRVWDFSDSGGQNG